MRTLLLVLAFAAAASPAWALDPSAQPDPILQAVQTRLGQCVLAEISLSAQIADLNKRLAAETKRADDLEAKHQREDKTSDGAQAQ